MSVALLDISRNAWTVRPERSVLDVASAGFLPKPTQPNILKISSFMYVHWRTIVQPRLPELQTTFSVALGFDNTSVPHNTSSISNKRGDRGVA